MIAGEGVRYPWSDFEEEQRRNFPNGAPDPLYDKYGELFGVTTHSSQTTGIYVLILGIILNHHCMTLFLPPRCTWCIVNLLSQTLLYKHYVWGINATTRMSSSFPSLLRRAGTGTGSRSSFLPTLMLSTLGLNRKEIFS